MFKEVIPLLVPDYYCDFVCTDDFRGDVSVYDAILCGGGDIVNRYFFSKLERILKGFVGPVYLLGVGIPYPSMLEDPSLNLFDHFFLRESTDLRALSRRFGTRYVHLLPTPDGPCDGNPCR